MTKRGRHISPGGVPYHSSIQEELEFENAFFPGGKVRIHRGDCFGETRQETTTTT